MQGDSRLVKGIASFSIAALVVVYLSGGFDAYWERQKSVYDPLLKKYRCMEIGERRLMEGEPPCAALTVAGRRALESRTEECEKRGGEHDKCLGQAYGWLRTKLHKTGALKDVPGRLYYSFYSNFLKSRL